jgi:hypothetical protein
MARIVFYILLIPAVAACREKYELPYTGPATGFLVVDGVINSGQGLTSIRLSRTLALVDSFLFKNETHAAVMVEGENNTQYPLFETGEGVYTNSQLNLQQNEKYRLRIRTSDGKIYLSDFTENKRTPDIDAISWEREEDGLIFYVNTHDPQNNTWYYKWDYEETWEFHSAYHSELRYAQNNQGDPVGVEERPYAESMAIFTCWQSDKAKDILIGSSKKLERDTIHLPIHSVENGSWKIGVLYSLMVRQHAISAASYEFLQLMKKNTEQLGTLFDAQPSELRGNVHCENDPEEIVIGFVDVSEAKEKRIFINRNEVTPWSYRMVCEEISVFNHRDSIVFGMEPTTVHIRPPTGSGVIRYYASTLECVDCRSRGTNVKPSFWP